MLEPRGPLPPQIYRRRRAAALAAVAVVTAGVVGTSVYLTTNGGNGDVSATGSSSVSTSQTSEEDSADGGSTDASGSTTSSGSPEPSSDIVFPPEDAVTGGSAEGGSAAAAPADAGGDVPADQALADGTAVPAPAPADGAVATCADQSLAIKAIPDNGSYPDGSPIGFTVVITNIADAACQRDLGSGMQQVLVYTPDDRRLWSSLDCFPAGESDMRVLEPGQQARFTVQWSGATSEPGCQAPRTPVGAGDFEVIGQLGDLKSSPEAFKVT